MHPDPNHTHHLSQSRAINWHHSAADESANLAGFSENERELIIQKRDSLAPIATYFSKDCSMPIQIGKPGSGWSWNFERNFISADPNDLLVKPIEWLRFNMGHEGLHRLLTDDSQIPDGIKRTAGAMWCLNAVEDPRINNYGCDSNSVFASDMPIKYKISFTDLAESRKKMIEERGFVPQSIAAGQEIIRQWAFKRQGLEIPEPSPELSKQSIEILERTFKACEEAYGLHPSEDELCSDPTLIGRYAKASFEIIERDIWPQFKALCEQDVNEEMASTLGRAMMNQPSPMDSEGQGESAGHSQLPPELLSQAQSKLTEDARQELQSKAAVLSNDPELKPGKAYATLSEKCKEELRRIAHELAKEEPKNQLTQGAEQQIELLLIEESSKLKGKIDKTAVGQPTSPPSSVEPAELGTPFAESDDFKNFTEALREELNRDPGTYAKYRAEVSTVSQKLEQELRRIFEARKAVKIEPGQRSGLGVDIPTRITEVARGVPAPLTRAFTKTTLPTEKDYFIETLLDLSGSMRGDKIKHLLRAAISIAEPLNRLNVSYELHGFNQYLYPLKGADEKLGEDSRERIGGILKEVSKPAAQFNDDGWAVSECATDIKKRREQVKILLVISDGSPIPSSDHSGQEYDLKSIVSEIERGGDIIIVGIGIGAGTESVAQYYSNNLVVPNVKELPTKLCGLLKRLIDDSGARL